MKLRLLLVEETANGLVIIRLASGLITGRIASFFGVLRKIDAKPQTLGAAVFSRLVELLN